LEPGQSLSLRHSTQPLSVSLQWGALLVQSASVMHPEQWWVAGLQSMPPDKIPPQEASIVHPTHRFVLVSQAGVPGALAQSMSAVQPHVWVASTQTGVGVSAMHSLSLAHSTHAPLGRSQALP
jgi:hypothetical protein